jgi:hypothetical protein
VTVALLVPLRRAYAAREGSPVVHRVEAALFTHRYFGACLSCGFCADACCRHGVDADAHTVARILARADTLEPVVGLPRGDWFETEREDDADAPGGWFTRTRTRDGYCVFKNRAGRGCLLHAWALGAGEDYHLVKPMVSALFPVTFGDGTLCLSEELQDGTLVCEGPGPTAYEAARGELLYYFGEELVGELDSVQAAVADRPASRTAT